MKNLFGINGVRVKTFVVEPNDNRELNKFLESDNEEDWFNKVKEMCDTLGYASNIKEYKNRVSALLECVRAIIKNINELA